MAKKLSLLIAAVAVVAFAVPAMASAAPVVTQGGVAVKTPAKVLGTNVGGVSLTTTILGTLTCEEVSISGELTVNNGTTVTGVGTGVGTTGKCTREGKAITVEDTTVSHLESTVSGSGKVSFTTKANINGTICSFTGTNVPYTYTVGGTNITFTNAAGVTSAACGATKLDGTFKLTIGGAAVVLD